MSAKNNVAIALIALAAGTALGVLFAPASGKDTRKKIAKKGTDLRDRMSDMISEGGNLIDKLKGEASDLAAKGKDAMNSSKDRMKDAASEVAGAARTTSNGGGRS